MSTLRIGTREGLFDLTNGQCQTAIEKRRITHLAQHGVSWWAVADRTEILYQEARDAPWKSVGTMRGGEVTSILPAPWGLLVGTSRARLFRLRRDSFETVPALEEAPGRERWHSPNGDVQARSLSCGPAGSLYVNIHVGGIVRSLDKGATFEAAGLEIEHDVHQVLAHPEVEGLVYGASASGLCVSDDRGVTWKTIASGLHASYARAIALAADTVLLAVSTGPGGGRAALYRTPASGGKRFERCREGLPEWFSGNINTGCLASRGTTVAVGDPRGAVYTSGNAGSIWRQVAAALPPVLCLAIS